MADVDKAGGGGVLLWRKRVRPISYPRCMWRCRVLVRGDAELKPHLESSSAFNDTAALVVSRQFIMSAHRLPWRIATRCSRTSHTSQRAFRRAFSYEESVRARPTLFTFNTRLKQLVR